MKLIVKGDDLGFTQGVNLGMVKAATDGVLTCCGLMPNMEYAAEGIELMSKFHHISIGQHTNIVTGTPITPPELIPSLVDDHGNFKRSNVYREAMLRGEDIVIYDEALLEIRAQLQRFIQLAGKKPSYLEGHATSSMNFKKALMQVADEQKIVHINYDGENRYGIKRTRMPDYPQDMSKNIITQKNFDTVQYFLNDADVLKHDLTMITFHPGYVDHEILQASTFSIIRANDLYALCSEEVKEFIKKNHIELINFNDIGYKEEIK